MSGRHDHRYDYKSHFVIVLSWQETTTDYVNSIQDAINDTKAKAEDFNSREKVIEASSGAVQFDAVVCFEYE